MKKEMLINVLQPEECRIAIVEDGVLEELYVERASQESYVGNIYKGKIVNIEPSIQAVFVDFGIGRNGFLHVTDVDPVYYRHLLPKELLEELEEAEENERGGGRSGGGRPRQGGRDRQEPRQERAPSEFRQADRPAQPAFVAPLPAPPMDDDEGFFTGFEEDDPAPAPRAADVEAPALKKPEPMAKPQYIPVEAPPVVKYIDDEDFAGFGEGLDFEDASQPVDSAEDAPVELTVAAPSPVAETEVEPDEIEDKPKAKGRAKAPAAKKPKAKAEEAEEKPKAKGARKGKKKSDDDPDEKPKPMDAAEQRTSEDDEPEIRPFFDDESSAFDPDAPNDRFGGAKAEGDDEVEDLPKYVPAADDDDAPAPVLDDLDDLEGESQPQPRRRDDDRRGGGGGRSGGGGGRGRDGGSRSGGDRGGDRGGRSSSSSSRGGPSRGAPPINKAHTRHKGLPIPPIQEIFKRGQEVIIQVIKEGIGTKGPTLSTFVSIAGRYLVLMPSLNRVGVSKKIEDRDARYRLRDIMNKMNPPKGVGFIVRTAAVDRDENELHNDLAYLLRLWQVVVRRIKRVAAPVEIYRESDMITRTIRDIFSADIDTIVVDEEKSFGHASEFLQIVMPKFASRIRFHGEAEPLFHKYRIDEEIAKINAKRLDLPGGGSIIIEQTEALVAIDVNSGNFRDGANADETAFLMNCKAAKEIARQIRLRDLGGVIVNDFIEMRREEHRRKVEDVLRDSLKRDRARSKVSRISEFGLIEMTRQRMQPSLKKRIFNDCPHCTGTGFIKNCETMGIEVMRLLQLAAHRAPNVGLVTVSVNSEVAQYLANKKRKEIAALEVSAGMEVQIDAKFGGSPELLEFKAIDQNGVELRLAGGPLPKAIRTGPPPRLPEANGAGRRYQD